MPKCLHRLISLLGVAGSLASLSPVSAQSLTDFTIRHETVGAQDPTGVVWWQDMWYAVGRGGAVYRSADGVAWNASMMLLRDADGIAQRNTANGPDKLVANENTIVGIGEGGRIFRTVDGEVWDAIASPTGETDLNAIAYANGEWHIVGDAGTLLRSRDEGLTWEQFSPNLERDWDAQNFRDVAYAQDNWWIADGNDVYRGQGVGLFELETMPGDVRWRTLYGDLLNDRVWAAGDQTIAYKDSDSGAWLTRNLVGSEGFMTTIVVTDEDVLVGDSGNRFWSADLLTMAFQPFVFNVGNSFRDATDAAFNGTQTIILTERSDFGKIAQDAQIQGQPVLLQPFAGNAKAIPATVASRGGVMPAMG